MEVRSDEMFSNGASGYYQTVYDYNMLSNDGYARNTYKRIYKVVVKTNSLINFDINKLDNAASNQVEANYYVGQAYALRVLNFFTYYGFMIRNILVVIRELYFL